METKSYNESENWTYICQVVRDMTPNDYVALCQVDESIGNWKKKTLLLYQVILFLFSIVINKMPN